MGSHSIPNWTCIISGREYRSQLGRGNMLRALATVWLAVAWALTPCAAADVPVVRGDLGPCTADFTVTDGASKPLYDAKIHVTIVYGFMNKRKSELEVGTDSNGKARFEGLPDKVKKILEFRVRQGDKTKSVMHDPSNDCHAAFTVVLDAP